MKERDQTAASGLPLNLEGILELIRDSPGGASADEIGEALELNRTQRKHLSRALNTLQGTGIIRRSANQFRWADSQRVYLGVLRQRRRKSINFIPDDQHGPRVIRVDADYTNGAFDGDRVIASVPRQYSGKAEARVELILGRGTLRIIGRLHRAHRFSFVESLDEKFPFDIDVEPGEDDEDRRIVVVEVTAYPTAHEHPRGRIIERLGAFSTDPGLDIEIVIRKHDLPHVFPPEVEREIEQGLSGSLPGAVNLEGRLDLRDQLIVTIDGETARDFDDAISLERLENGNYSLGVHIADVSYYVRHGTALDQEARLRGTSVYFPERAIPMLPEALSTGICSLNPDVDRLTLSAIMEVDGQGAVVSYQIRETIIRSRRRMTYTDVHKILTHSDDAVVERYREFHSFFELLEIVARILIDMRKRRGAIDFNLPEAIFQFNDEGHIGGVLKADRNIAHRIIEEFMLLANETVAGHLERLGIPSLYRIHEEPDPQRVIEFSELAAAYGFRFPVEGVSSFDYQRLSGLLTGKPEEKVLSYAMLRSMQRARYAAVNAGHFGLASQVYTHFTSPIRRYPDLIVHRILRALLSQSPDLGSSSAAPRSGTRRKGLKAPIDLRELEEIALESSERERAADAAEMELEEWRKAVLMAGHIGDEFAGLIISVRDFGFFVELEDLFVDGLVAVASLGDDFYHFDRRSHSLTGQQRRRTFRIGDRLQVRVERVNVDRHLIDFVVVGSTGRVSRPMPRARTPRGKRR